MNDYQRIIDYNFSDIVLDDKLVVKFKVKKTFNESQFISLFSSKRGERFIIRTPDTKHAIIGIGYESTWLLDSNDFLTSFDNSSVLSGFEELKTQVTFLDIDEHDEEYFGIYGGVSDGKNKSSQEWVDFSDTTFVIPGILAVFKEEEVYFTLFFNMKEEKDFTSLWHERIQFLEELENYKEKLNEREAYWICLARAAVANKKLLDKKTAKEALRRVENGEDFHDLKIGVEQEERGTSINKTRGNNIKR